MKNKIHVAVSPLTNTIFAGSVLKDGRTWAANKTDVTIECLLAVVSHTLKFGKPVIISSSIEPEFEITVRDLRKNTTTPNHKEK